MENLRTPPMPAPRRAGLADYLKRAFLYRWNLLAFCGGVAAAALSPWPDGLLPLVAAIELAYLAGLVSNTRFRQAVEAELHQQRRQPQRAPASQLQEMLNRLPPPARKRFEQLRGRCLEMRAIAEGVRGRLGTASGDDLTTGALDRLLWVFLRLLASQEALQRFLSRTDPAEIRRRIEEAQARLADASAGERVRRSLEDSIAAQQLRLDNYEKAVQNAEFVRVELDRIEAKIQALTESAVNRQDTELWSSQIDSVAESMQSTEKALSELQQITGYVDELQAPPAILTAGIGPPGGS